MRSLFVLAISAIAANGMWAATQGTTHDYPIDDNTTKKYLTEYLGITNYSGSNWGYTSSSDKSANATAPTATTKGDVLFIEVNDYWKGSNWKATPSLYNQVKYGVKSINKVTQSASIGSGMLYHYDATTNRFFFAIRTSSIYTGDAEWKKVGNRSSKYYMSESYKMPLRWYNEFSATTSTSGDGWDVLDAAYDKLKDGFFYPVPHSCSNSLEKNHFTSLYPKTATEQTYTVSAMLYVPTGANATTNQKNGSFKDSSIPQVFFYINKLDGARVDNPTGTECKYAADLTWKTSFDLAPSSFKPWVKGTVGVREVSEVYRQIEGTDEFELVETTAEDVKHLVDKTLPNPGTDGYDVTYYIVTKAITCDANGKSTGKLVGAATTNQATIHIPGSDEKYFELSISNTYNSKFHPAMDQFNKSYNEISNDITSKPNRNTPALQDIKVGDKFQLIRYQENGNTVLNELVIKAINGTTYAYTLNGIELTSTWTQIENLLTTVANYLDKANLVPSKTFDARYILIYTTGDKEYKSNMITSRSMQTPVVAQKLYRSGTPDPEHNTKQELYTCRVNFKPVMDGSVAYYYIWKNAEERLMRVDHVNSETYAMVGKDANGNFNVPMGNISIDRDGYLEVRVDAAIDKHANDYEMSANQAEAQGLSGFDLESPIDNGDLFFTVEVCTTGGNSYGNIDQNEAYNGDKAELVYNSKINVFTDNHGNYRAEVNWDKIVSDEVLDEDDYVLGDPDYYTVYRGMINEDGDLEYTPITARYIGHDGEELNKITGEIEPAGFTKVDETTDGSAYKFTPEMIKEIENTRPEGFKVMDFIYLPDFKANVNILNSFPAMYYVKANYEHPFEAQTFVARNFVEKNSNPTNTSVPIVTAVEDIHTGEIVSVKYYNMLGIEVAQPEAGEVVVARTQYADGTMSSKVIRK